MDSRIRIGISSCLLGERVRYDGGHKRDSVLIHALGKHFALVPVCPEVGCGMPTPREAMRLEGDPADPRLIAIESRIDLTGRMRSYCLEKVAELEREGVCGFVCKENSPSCGSHQVQVYRQGVATGKGRGLFAAQLLRRFPLLPVEGEGSLADPVLRENFIQRVFAYSRGGASGT